ncbi:MAG: ThiF family adenylyltransferase [Lautropia sp.]
MDGAGRRFDASARLFGADGVGSLAAAHVVVVGVGGVGSWAAEGLVRSGVGRVTMIDLDHVAESNINRQVHALESTVGAAKVDVMARRLRDIAPGARIDAVEEFVTVDNVAALVPADADVVIDAIDKVPSKAAMVALCVARGQAVVVCGGAGGRRDPLRLRRTDLTLATADAMLSTLRLRLRRRHGFPLAPGGSKKAPPFGVQAIWSDEPSAGGAPGATIDTKGANAPLACAGYGSLVAVTASMGFAAAQAAIEHVLAGPRAGIAAAGACASDGVACKAPSARVAVRTAYGGVPAAQRGAGA